MDLGSGTSTNVRFIAMTWAGVPGLYRVPTDALLFEQRAFLIEKGDNMIGHRANHGLAAIAAPG